MRKIVTPAILFAVVISSTFFLGCKKTPTMSAKINGETKNFIFRSTNKVGITDGLEGIVLVATTGSGEGSGEYLTLLVRGANEGTYNLNVQISSEAKFQCEAIYRPGGETDTTTYKGTSGTINITKIDKKYISGTFSFEMRNKVSDSDVMQVTEGKFEDLRYYSTSLSDVADAAFDL